MDTISEISFFTKIKGYVSLLKLRLSSLVVMSAFFGFLLAGGDLNSTTFVKLIVGGILTQDLLMALIKLLAKTDALMSRTSFRPLPSKILNTFEAVLFCSSIGFTGLYLLLEINSNSFILGLLAMVIYIIIYTPLKKITPFAVFIGAIPGSIPPLLGYIAVSNSFGLEPEYYLWSIFLAISHFWAFMEVR